jgi:uncharacterized protein (DUF1330 family)
VAGPSGDVREGEPGVHTVVLRFASKEAAQGWYDSPEYQAISTYGRTTVAAAW